MGNEEREANGITTIDNFSQFESVDHSKSGQINKGGSDPSSRGNINSNSDQLKSKVYYNV